MDSDQRGLKAGEPPQIVTFDALLPAAVAARAEAAGVKKASTDALTLIVLSVLAGAFISLGAIFSTTISVGGASIVAADGAVQFSTALPYGVTRLLVGLTFTIGLLLVMLAGAELFTGNAMIVMAWANRKVSTRQLLLNWTIVFLGNFVGASATAVLLFYSTQYTFADGAIGLAALNVAHAKASLDFMPALTLGIMCNALVCLAVWMCYGARTILEKTAAAIPPVAAFAASGFEHSIANVYFFSIGLFIKAGAPDSFWASIHKTAADFPALTWTNFLIGNLVPVTIGNIFGGAIMVAAVYWFVYLRKRPI